MVEGINIFKEKFRGFEDCYTVIGGTACDILMAEADIDFRRTKDIDMILILEEKRSEFAKVFWEYIKEGQYKCGWRNSDIMHFYRFTEPVPGYPVMIELFSRKPGYTLEIEEGIIPIHIDDDISSLSAILLNDDFYELMLKGRRVIDDVCVLDADHIIPFKMYAWVDLKRKKASGFHVNERDYKKHKNDVFRLLQIVDPEKIIETDGFVRESIETFLTEVESEPVETERLGLQISKEDALKILRLKYL